MFACYCLNILVETEEKDDFEKVKLDTLHLNEAEINDKFFQQDLRQIKKLLNITKVHPSLVQTRVVGNWTISCCLNCAWEVYAVHKEKGASCVLIYSNLRDSRSIEAARADDETVSKVFNIIVNTGDNKENDIILNSYRHCDVEAIIKYIRQTMANVLRRETLAVEERIKRYAEQQYELLNNLKDAAYLEHDALVRLLQGLTEQPKPESTNLSLGASVMQTPPRLSDKKVSSPRMNVSSEKPIMNLRHTPKRQKSSPAAIVSSFDAEGLFEFEGSDGIGSVTESDFEESDKEEMKEDGINIPRSSRGSTNSIAKSLPMNIPAFMSQAKNASSEDLDDFPQDENLDIAASIKALARSVHGDAVFGELPRPRFSTQI